MASYFKTATLMAVMTALFMGLGFLLGGRGGMMFALLMAGGMNLFTWWNSDKMVLKSYDARPVDRMSAPDLHALVADLARRGELPMPKVYLLPTDQPNAFATGRNPENAAVAVTAGLMRALSREELAGVIAHELAHVKNRDTLIMTVTATFAGAISMLANFAMFMPRDRDNPGSGIAALFTMIFAPLAAAIVQMAVSRTREYEADRIGARICGNPLWLASALERIEASASRIDNVAAERNPATAPMFIINPLHALRRDKLFSTHPSTANRVAELLKLAAEMRIRPEPAPERGGFSAPSAPPPSDDGREVRESTTRIPRSGGPRQDF